jgi:hypothetical protein
MKFYLFVELNCRNDVVSQNKVIEFIEPRGLFHLSFENDIDSLYFPSYIDNSSISNHL